MPLAVVQSYGPFLIWNSVNFFFFPFCYLLIISSVDFASLTDTEVISLLKFYSSKFKFINETVIMCYLLGSEYAKMEIVVDYAFKERLYSNVTTGNDSTI